jgi:hypothetical protein
MTRLPRYHVTQQHQHHARRDKLFQEPENKDFFLNAMPKGKDNQ